MFYPFNINNNVTHSHIIWLSNHIYSNLITHLKDNKSRVLHIVSTHISSIFDDTKIS